MATNNKPAKGRTKTEVYQLLATKTGLTRKQVSSVVDELVSLVKSELGKKARGFSRFQDF